MNPAGTSPRQKTALVCLGVFLTFIFIEAGLRTAGFLYKAAHRAPAAGGSSESGGAYRILCLGESTTAPAVIDGADISWPAQLERILNERSPHKTFVVFNEGIWGLSSAAALSKLDENLRRHRPDMVVAMLGINDDEDTIPYEPVFTSKAVLFIRSLRSCKLLRLLHERLAPAKNTAGSSPSGEGYSMAVEEAAARKLIKSNPRDDPAHLRLARLNLKRSEWAAARTGIRRALEINPRSAEGRRLLSRLNARTDEREDPARSTPHAATDSLPSLRLNSRKIGETVLGRGMKLLSMEYPLRDAGTLKGYLDGTAGVVLVSNEETFKKALLESPYDELFIDRFAGDFGHCTQAGNRLIARNLAGKILKELSR